LNVSSLKPTLNEREAALAEASFHTDQDEADLLRRWGIKVSGELPPGTPWWDAKSINLTRSDFARKAPGCFLFVFVGAIVAMALAGTFGQQWWIWAGFAALLVLLPFLWRRSLIPVLDVRHLEITDMELLNQLESWRRVAALGTTFRPILDFSDLFSARRIDLRDVSRVEPGTGYVCIKIRKHTDLVLRTGLLAIGTGAFCRLLAYRIAKANGENPPPPEFS